MVCGFYLRAVTKKKEFLFHRTFQWVVNPQEECIAYVVFRIPNCPHLPGTEGVPRHRSFRAIWDILTLKNCSMFI